jgi:acyl-CoA thioesterase FadM
MYPFVRMFWQLWRHRKDGPRGLMDEHVSHHICWPWDLDFWRELNNGRTLTLYDLGRVPAGRGNGLFDALRAQKWGLAVAGASVRYRKRVLAFDRIRMRSRTVGWDDRFIYVEQSMWKTDGECASHILIRSAITSRKGIIAPDRLAAAMGWQGPRPPLPDWVTAWIAAEGQRPWPPMSP